MNKFKPLLYVILAAGFILVTFFGLGPVLLADGSAGERIITLIAVIILYIALILVFIRVRKSGS